MKYIIGGFLILATLGCLLTVGGVYAQWIYGQASAGSVSESIIPQMAGVGENSKKGTISIKTSGLTMVIDDAGGYKPELIISGSVDVTFVANPGADQNVKDNGIVMKYSLSMSSGWQYDSDFDGTADKDIFTLEGNYTDIPANYVEGSGQNEQTKSFVISNTWFEEHVKLNVASDFVLDTKEKFNSFKSHLNKANSLFTLTVSEVE